MKRKILVIVGPTASGKSKLAIDLAIKYNGEVISADSRQVYKDLNVGTEKVSKEEMQGVPHHLIDVAEAKEIFTVKDFVEKASLAVEEILSRGKLPIIAGGTGFYVDALIYGIEMPEVPANHSLRAELEEKDEIDLFSMLLEKDPRRAATIDPHNKRRLIRALEIIKTLGAVPKNEKRTSQYDSLVIGIVVPDDELHDRIDKRLLEACGRGLVEEVKKLRDDGLSWDRLNELGLEYRIAAEYLRNEIDDKEMYQKMCTSLKQYAKRQKTWFKRNEDIKWFSIENDSEIHNIVEDFMGS